MKPIRNSAKALILDEQERILLTKNQDEEGFFYLLPGGGQEKGEKLTKALIRECQEELGVSVIPHDIVYIREYIGKHHEYAAFDADVHQVEFIFSCSLYNDDLLKLKKTSSFVGTNPDDDQVGVEWIELQQLDDIRLYPKELKKYLKENKKSVPHVYIGDVN